MHALRICICKPWLLPEHETLLLGMKTQPPHARDILHKHCFVYFSPNLRSALVMCITDLALEMGPKWLGDGNFTIRLWANILLMRRCFSTGWGDGVKRFPFLSPTLFSRLRAPPSLKYFSSFFIFLRDVVPAFCASAVIKSSYHAGSGLGSIRFMPFAGEKLDEVKWVIDIKRTISIVFFSNHLVRL